MRTLYVGSGVALAAGLLLGAVMKPELAVDDQPAGPQIVAGLSGPRSSAPFDEAQVVASSDGQIPDYVLGTDWLKPPWMEPSEAPDVVDPATGDEPLAYPEEVELADAQPG